MGLALELARGVDVHVLFQIEVEVTPSSDCSCVLELCVYGVAYRVRVFVLSESSCARQATKYCFPSLSDLSLRLWSTTNTKDGKRLVCTSSWYGFEASLQE